MGNKKQPYLKSRLPLSPQCFYGREKELKEIHKRFQGGEHILFLQGIGGIGKSELAKKYAISYQKYYRTVIFSQCVSDLKTLIIDDEQLPVAYMKRDETELEQYEEEEEYLERKYKILKELENESTLIIIDDFNQKEDVYLNAFFMLNYKILVTSRVDWSSSGYPYMLIQQLEDLEDIKKIFYTYYEKERTEEEERLVTEIIQKVKGHTLTVEWIAKQMSDDSTDLKTIGESLDAGTLSENFEEMEVFFEQLKNVFQVNELSEEEQDVLRIMSLIPYTGITREDLLTRSKRGSHAGVLKLMRNSWIEIGEEMGYIYLHPVISELVIRELHPTWKNCSYFIKNVEKDLIDTRLENQRVEKLFPIALNMIEKLGTQESESVIFMLDLAYALQFRKGEYHIAEHYANRALRVQAVLKEEIDQELELYQRDVMDIEYNELRTAQYHAEYSMCMAINRLGCIYYEQKTYKKALEQFKKLLNYLPMMDPFCNIASCYQNMDDLEEALHYTKLGLAYKQKRFGKKTPYNFPYYKQFGMIYTQMKEEDNAIYYFEEAKKIIEQEVKEKDLYRAQFYSQYGDSLKQMKRFSDALELEKMSLEIKQSLLGENHIEVAKSYAVIAFCYYYLKQYKNTLWATLKEIKIRKNIGQIKLKLYMSVTRLLPLLEEELEKDDELSQVVEEVMGELNDLLQKYPEKLEEIMAQ